MASAFWGMGIAVSGGCPERVGPARPPCQGKRSEPVADGLTTVEVTATIVTSARTRKAMTKTLTLVDRGISPRVCRRELADARPYREYGPAAHGSPPLASAYLPDQSGSCKHSRGAARSREAQQGARRDRCHAGTLGEGLTPAGRGRSAHRLRRQLYRDHVAASGAA